jgi:hypothetical protein
MTFASQQSTRSYDIIGFGDEVPGILAIVAAAREIRRCTGKNPRTLVMFKGDSQQGVGGHLVRGGLAYLDRSSIPPNMRQSMGLPTFGDPVPIYKEFLQRSFVTQIALDPRYADVALRTMLSDVQADIISRVEIRSVLQQGTQISGIELTRGETFLGRQFIDSTVNAELAQAAGVKKLKGFETFGLPESELPVTLVFETEGLSIQQLREAELSYLRRFSNLNDREAQHFLTVAAGSDAQLIAFLRKSLVDNWGNFLTMDIGPDHIDIRSRALSIAYHSFRGKKLSLNESGSILDQANIAVLPGGRLSWNALLFRVSGSQAEALARADAKPDARILEEFKFIDKWFRSLGATTIRPMPELYIRHAGNIQGVVEPLSGAQMLAGGVPANEALATFSYHLDVRGGIEGLGTRASTMGAGNINFHAPPMFNVGIRHALVKNVPNLAVISPASGFDGYACAAGRIVEFNVAVGQGVGIAAAIALLSNRTLASITNQEVRRVMAQTGQLPRIYGQPNLAESSRLMAFETTLGTGTAIA